MNLAHQQEIFNLRNNLEPEQRPAPAYQAIAASNIQPGEGDLIATCDARIGSLLVHQVTVRRDLAGNNYVEFPDVVEITSLSLGEYVRSTILAAVAEGVR